jgi:hypothetical protein
MIDALHGAGAMGWLVLLLGFSTVATAIVFAAAPTRTGFAAAIALVCTTVASGLLGTVVGMVQSYGAVASADPSMRAALLARGISEAMNCTAFGLGTLVLWIPPFVIGTVRRAGRG